MAWTESHTVLIRHRKTINLAIFLGIEPVHAVGHLTVFWHNVLEQAEDGDIAKWSDEFIAQSACWKGDANTFCKALRSVGWLDNDGKIHDWLDYAGRYLYNKYHSSNPQKWEKIRRKHKAKKRITFSRTKGRPKEHIDNLDKITIDNLDNIHTKMKFLDAVFLTNEEHKKLVERFGEAGTAQRIAALNNGIMSKGYRYKSHYHTILSWEQKNERDTGGRRSIQGDAQEDRAKKHAELVEER